MVRTIRKLAVVAVIITTACGVEQYQGDVTPSGSFDVGESDDPVLKSQAVVALPATDTVTFTVSNSTGYTFTQGLILFSVPFQVGSPPSSAFASFVLGSSSAKGNASLLASNLGLSVGSSAFLVPSIVKSGGQQVLTIQVPVGSKVTYVARVDGSVDDFVAITNLGVNTGGTIVGAMQGYDANAPTTVQLNNGTTGQVLTGTNFTMVNASDCPVVAANTRLVDDDFSAGANSKVWPSGFGWDGEFNGDWYTDGTTVRVYNPNWGGADPKAPIPTVTGFWKTIDLCPAVGGMLQVDAKVVTQLSDSTSDTTLVVYFFDRAGSLISVTANHPLYDDNDRTVAIHDWVIPTGTRKIAIAPMMRLGATETGDVFFDRISVDYQTPAAYTNTTLFTDTFSSTTNGGGNGKNQPTGWSDWGGDWYGMTTQQWATLGNPVWAGGKAGVDTGLQRTFTLPTLVAGDVLNAQIFAAATFTDKRSFVRLRVLYGTNNGSFVESQRQVRGWGLLEARRFTVPSGTTTVTVIVNAYLGPTEQSSLYVDDFALVKSHKN